MFPEKSAFIIASIVAEACCRRMTRAAAKCCELHYNPLARLKLTVPLLQFFEQEKSEWPRQK
jgi:hypothetical protein